MRPDIGPAGVYRSVEEAQLAKVAEMLIRQAEGLKIWLFRGELGSGKTTLIRELGRVLKAKDTVRSPSFSIINEYALEDGTRMYHFDFYRLQSEAEAVEVGVPDYLQRPDYCFIEWPEPIIRLVPRPFFEISIAVEENHHRTISALIHG